MKKVFIYILLIFHVFTAGNFGVISNTYISQVNALSSTWDFSTPGDYTLSDTTKINIRSGEADLIQQIIHTGAVADGAGGALLLRPRRVTVSGDYAYISAHDDDAIQIIDISDPSNPTVEGNIVNNNGTIRLDRPYDSVVNGNYLYVAAFQSDAIQIIDISDPSAPVAAGNFVNNATVRLNGPRGLSIQGDYLYVASYADDAVQVFDISTPTTLTAVDDIRAANDRLNGARDIIADGNYAYVTARNDDSIQVIDISDPANISFAGEIVDDSATVFLDSVWGLEKSGDYLYVGGYFDDGVQIIDVSAPTAPTAVSFTDNTELTNLSRPRDVKLDGDYLYIADLVGDSIMSMDISDPLDTFKEFELPNSGTTFLNGPRDIQVIGNFIYVASNTDNDFVILEKTYDTESPTIIPNTAFNFGSEDLSSFTETLGVNNAGTVTYQISRNNGTDWYYYNGSAWTLTTAGVSESSSASVINTNIDDFNSVGTGNEFLWKAFLTSNGTEKVEIDNIDVVSSAAIPSLSITKTDNDPDNTVQTDQVVRYTITLTNTGSDATGISITDTIDTDFGSPYNFTYDNCGSPSEGFVDPTLTFSSVSVDGGTDCTITYDLQVDSSATTGATINNSADPSAATEGGNDPIAATADSLTILACGTNDVTLNFTTDNWGEDTYWSLTPNGNACGAGEIANGGNTVDGSCTSGGSQTADAANGYADNTTINEGPYTLTVGAQYDLHVVDDWGDGMTGDPDVTVTQNGSITDTFVVENTGGIFTFTVQEPTGCTDTINPSVSINQADGQADPTLVDSATFKVVFNEVINTGTFTSGDITLSGTTGTVTSGPSQVAPNNGTSFEFIVTGMTDGDIVTATMTGGVVEDVAGNTNNASTSTDNQVTYTGGDTTPPVISSINFASGSLLPGGNHTIAISYSDADSGINTGTNNLELYKWDGVSAYGPNLMGSQVFLSSLTSTGATYDTSDLTYGKYQYSFSISDNDGNTATEERILYIDEPEFLVGTGAIDIGTVNHLTNVFSDTVTITVRTVGAGFSVHTNTPTPSLSYDTEAINAWDGTTGFGYDQVPYTTNISAIGTNQNIATQTGSINTNGDKNTYTYDIKLGALIDILQAGGDYEGKIDFGIILDY